MRKTNISRIVESRVKKCRSGGLVENDPGSTTESAKLLRNKKDLSQGGMDMKASEFARTVAEMIESEKETFKELIENEDWEILEDEVFEYISQAD